MRKSITISSHQQAINNKIAVFSYKLLHQCHTYTRARAFTVACQAVTTIPFTVLFSIVFNRCILGVSVSSGSSLYHL